MDASEKYYRFPAPEAPDEYITEYMRRHFAEYFTYRSRHMERIAKNIYYEIGRQWVERDLRQLAEGSRGFAFRDMRNTNVELPRPVTNYITPAVDVEFATLSKRQWTPKIPTFSRDPRMEAAAKIANEILNDRLKKLHWEDTRDKFIRNLIVHGTAIVKSFWDETYQETTWVAAENPFICSVCGTLLQSDKANVEQVRGADTGVVIETENESPEDLQLTDCPACGAPIVPYDEMSEEQSRGTDYFKRPLGQEMPMGNTNIELYTPFEYYPQNHGINVAPETITQHGMCKIRSLDWVEDHFPDLIDKVEPETPEVLLRERLRPRRRDLRSPPPCLRTLRGPVCCLPQGSLHHDPEPATGTHCAQRGTDCRSRGRRRDRLRPEGHGGCGHLETEGGRVLGSRFARRLDQSAEPRQRDRRADHRSP
jgi:hypothetical protein